MSLELTEEQINTVETIAEEQGIHHYNLDLKSATLKGDGYSGDLISVIIQGDTKNLHLILKRAVRTEYELLRLFWRKAYLREIYIYNQVLREFKHFQRENNVTTGFEGFPKIFGSNDKESSEYLFLENLKENGYRMWNRKEPMNDEHMALVFSEYGKFHAVSMAMKEKKPELFNELTKHLDDYYGSSLPKEEASQSIRNILKKGYRAVEDNDAAAKVFEKFTSVAEEFLLEDLQNVDDHLVVIHGDSWCNNMLFKYDDIEDIQKPTKVCLIDWQLSKVGSPILDLAYFFFGCTTGDELRNSEKYLKIYHDAVSESLANFSCVSSKLFPFALLESQWRKYAKYGLYTALMIVDLMLCDVDEVKDWNEPENSNKSGKENRSAPESNKRIINILHVMSEQGLI